MSNAATLRAELEHLWHGTPLAEPMYTDSAAGPVHRVRKHIGAQSAEQLVERDRQVSEQARNDLRKAQVVVLLVGTTAELWLDRQTGAPFNEIPPPNIHADDQVRLDPGGLDSLREDIRRIQDIALENLEAKLVLAACPIPLYATWLAEPILSANGRSKALLRAAIDAELKPEVRYLDLWDWTVAQAGGRSPMQPDARHFSWRGTDRIMHFAEQRLSGSHEIPPLSLAHRARSLARDMKLQLRFLRRSSR